MLYCYYFIASIFLLHILFCEVSSKARICRTFRDSFPYEETARVVMKTDEQKCPPTVMPISIYHVMSTTKELTGTSGNGIF